MLQAILLLSVLLASCAGQSSAPQTSARPAPSSLPDEAVPADTIITLERSICFGSCPDYKLTIYGDGRLVYEGRKFVKTKGKVNSAVTQEQLRQLIAEFEKADFFSLGDSYQTAADGCPTVWTDNPNVNTSIQINGRKKSIVHDHGCQEKSETYLVYPQKLYLLEWKIDEIANSAQWVEGKGKEKKRR